MGNFTDNLKGKAKPDYTILYQWKKYCELVKLPEESLASDQMREMKRCFYGAWGQALIHLRDEVGTLSEQAAVGIMERQIKEVADFFLGEQGRQN